MRLHSCWLSQFLFSEPWVSWLRPNVPVTRFSCGTTTLRSAESNLAAKRGTRNVILNGLGQQGWELVGMTRREIRVDDALMTETIYTFKRPSRTVNR